MAGSCTGLLKTACACIKRIHEAVETNGKCDTIEHIQELDKLCLYISTLSPAIDNFGSEIYPPMNMNSVRLQVDVLLFSCFHFNLITSHNQTPIYSKI